MKLKFPILKTNELTSGGRVYSEKSVDFMMNNLKWDTRVAVVSKKKDGDEKCETLVRKEDLEFDRAKGILYVSIPKEVCQHIYGLRLSPMVEVEAVKRGMDQSISKEYIVLDAFFLHSIQASPELSSFKSIDPIINF